MVKVESYPAIVELDKFAEEIGPEYRARLYKTAISFLSIGASNGIYEAVLRKSDQLEWIEYLTKKSKETEADTKTISK